MDTFSQLLRAQSQAKQLFRRIEEEELIQVGRSETEISEAIFALGDSEFGVDKHWHRRIVRAGVNTRLPYREQPPERRVEADDIVSLDLGPVFGEYEADFGKTYVLGNQPEKLRLRDDLELIFHQCRAYYRERPELSGAELYTQVLAACAARGYGYGNSHAGHLVGPFAMARAERDAARNRIRSDNAWPMNEPDAFGKPRCWVLEIHLLDPTGAFGGFYEDLLNV
jgi:Xaa-Pro aminopeptidase